ncbi:MAG TPA: cytochrome c [Xanthobacteraceae bacterium]|jgi:ubiquinol-cytochrome c reductase cytochrome c subunit|nr:cytochrome c [Xanthobacteraceae bacterium]
MKLRSVPLSFLIPIQVAASFAASAPALAQGAPPAGDAANGKRVYMAIGCYQCHGTIGQGSRPTGPHIAPNPLPYAAFAGQVRRPVNAMPPYTDVVLSEQHLADIYAYLVSVPPLPDPKAAAILDH